MDEHLHEHAGDDRAGHHLDRHGHAPHDAAAEYAAALDAYRRDRDEAFALSDDSPLSEEDRETFRGLRYFPPDLRYRFEGLVLEPYAGDEPGPFVMQTSDGQPRQAHRTGTFRFVIGDRPLALHAYGFGSPDDPGAFVPFTDETSGHETYGAGRYLDLEPEDDGSYVLDFNLAYHPLCVYSPHYSCPIPPAENRLPVRIEAGEMMPEGPGGH